MIRDNVLNPSHVVLSQLISQSVEVGEYSQLRIQATRVNYIIAVEDTLHGCEYWRSVEVRYAQVGQVGND
jgi:hypothetical protein